MLGAGKVGLNDSRLGFLHAPGVRCRGRNCEKTNGRGARSSVEPAGCVPCSFSFSLPEPSTPRTSRKTWSPTGCRRSRRSCAPRPAVTSISAQRAAELASAAARNADHHTLCGHSQLHLVKSPGGARRQMTFRAEPVAGGSFQPKTGDCSSSAQDTRRRGIPSTLPLRSRPMAGRRCSPMGSRATAVPLGAQRPAVRLHLHPPHGQGHGHLHDGSRAIRESIGSSSSAKAAAGA